MIGYSRSYSAWNAVANQLLFVSTCMILQATKIHTLFSYLSGRCIYSNNLKTWAMSIILVWMIRCIDSLKTLMISVMMHSREFIYLLHQESMKWGHYSKSLWSKDSVYSHRLMILTMDFRLFLFQECNKIKLSLIIEHQNAKKKIWKTTNRQHSVIILMSLNLSRT